MTVAVSCVVWPLFSAVVGGLTLTATEGSSVIVVDEDAVVSARLVAVTVTVCAVVTVAGAVYRPDVLIEPPATGLTDHVTALFALLVTIAVSCAVWPLFSAVFAGLTLTATEGSSVIAVDEDAVVSAKLVAVTVTVCAVVMVAGAVYRPGVLIEPRATGLIVHVTALLAVLVTVAVSCSVWPLFSAVVAGLTLTATEGSSVIVVDEEAVGPARLIAVTVVEPHPRLEARDTRRR